MLLFIQCFCVFSIHAQAPEVYNTSDILYQLKKLGNTGRILYVAAHPDDENTTLISWLSQKKGYHTGYISLTRGSGGQNRIGSEIGKALGVIRTYELLEARNIDKGVQFFSAAKDFGYSKTADETFNIWNREQVLADLVRVIRTFKPDVVINRFSTEPGRTHGHHTASAILAKEAFQAAADPNIFPEQLQQNHIHTWQPQRLLFNTSWWFYGSKEAFEPHKDEFLQIDAGAFNPLKGKSYTEIGAEARSMHKSQGFGRAGSRGENIEYLDGVEGSLPKNHIMEGISTGFGRIQNGKQIAKLINNVRTKFDPENPEAIVTDLIHIKDALTKTNDPEHRHIIRRKIQETEKLIRACTGLFIETHVKEHTAVPGDCVLVNIEVVNRSDAALKLNKIELPFGNQILTYNQPLQNNEVFKKSLKIKLDSSLAITQPYWLKNKAGKGMYNIDRPGLSIKPLAPSALNAKYRFSINNTTLGYQDALVYKKEHPVEGIIYKPFEITPPVMTNLDNETFVFADHKPKELTVELEAGKAGIQGKCIPDLPEGWYVKPSSTAYAFEQKGAVKQLHFKIYPPEKADKGTFTIKSTCEGNTYTRGGQYIAYEHIPSKMLFPRSDGNLLKIDVDKKGKNIGYVMGAGDEVPEYLEQIGYHINILEPDELSPGKLAKFDAVIMGIRAYNTLPELKYYQENLMKYVQKGGTVITQYSKSHNLLFDDIGPYPVTLSHDRITDETAEMNFLKPQHPVLNTPNKIQASDFDNWVQERGLYFAGEWDQHYTPILAGHDPGEKATEGSLLVAKHGKGYYVYTGLAFFRQLPAGVPGAYRLFANLIALGN